MENVILKCLVAIIFTVIFAGACSSDAKETSKSGTTSQSGSPASGERIVLKTDDGWEIVGTLIKAANEKGGPAVVLAHKLNSTRSEWSELQTLLKAEGITTLAIDLRGHGESIKKNGATRKWSDFDIEAGEFLGMVTDIKTAVKYLRDKTEVDDNRIGLIGASIGSNASLRLLAEDSAIKTAIALSPGLDYHKVTTDDAVKKVTDRPMYLIAAEGDTYSADSVNKLYSDNTKQVTKEVITGDKHGVPMFETKPELKTKVVEWFKAKLK